MQERILPLLRCPVSRVPLKLQVISKTVKSYLTGDDEIIQEGILFAGDEWLYPVIGGIPRLTVEAFADYEKFLSDHLTDYHQRRKILEERHPGLLRYVRRKNKRTKESFSLEWSLYNYSEDRTWEAADDELLRRFLEETGEDESGIRGKLILDAGCGNGHLNQFIAGAGALVIGMDFSDSIERAHRQNRQRDAIFIQGDVQFPPLEFTRFDIVHSSGVLICTNNTELSFNCIERCVKPGGKLSTWLYHPRQDRIHHLLNMSRRVLSKLPLRLEYYVLLGVVFPPSYLIKRLKGNKQNAREMIIAILDQFTPEFRWEHTPDEATGWFIRNGYGSVTVTTTSVFGFNIVGIKPR